MLITTVQQNNSDMCVCVWGVHFVLSHAVISVSCDPTPWTVARQAPLSMDSPGKNTGVDYHFLLQGIFPTQESNPGYPALQADSLPTEL